jgi:sugar lactone lactonase YvrE
VRKITPDGAVTTLAGCGPSDSNWGSYAEGQGSAACFSTPLGIVAGPDGTLYVADSGNYLIRAIDQSGTVTTYAGNGEGSKTNSTRLSSGIPFPRGLAMTGAGDLYVTSDTGDIRLVSGDSVSTALRERKEASGLALAPDGTLYVVSTGTGNVSMLQGGSLVPLVNDAQTFGDQGGPGGSAQLRPAEGLVVDGNVLYVSDSANNRIRRIALSPDHSVSTLVGNGQAGFALGTGATARVTLPRGLALTPTGLIVADSGNHRILRVALPAR